MLRNRIRRCVFIFRYILCVVILATMLIICKINMNYDDLIKSKLSKNALKFVNFQEESYESSTRIETLRKRITKYNQEERIINLDIYGSVKSDDPILVIFVDKYDKYSNYFVASLQQVSGISDALIIFSHSNFDENSNALIKSIDFARVLQIFYPYSVQLYPEEFPGYHKDDCTRDMNINTAKHLNCTEADSPDIHGRYRDPKLAAMKHFWWWTANTVFERLSNSANHKGIFIFLEDDLFLIEDIIYMALQMQKTSKFINNCDFVALHTVGEQNFYEKKTHGVEIRTWDPKQHSSALAFDLRVWNSIAAHYYLFCSIDDYSWSRSLFYVSLNRKDGNRFKVISSTIPRAYKIGKFSRTFNQLVEYSMLNTIYNILEMQHRNRGKFFPVQLEVLLDIELDYDEFINFDYIDNNGGWSDPRDKKMCYNMTENKTRKIILDMNSEFNHYRDDDDDYGRDVKIDN